MSISDGWRAEVRRVAESYFGTDVECSVCGRSDDEAMDAIANYAMTLERLGRDIFAICGHCSTEIAQLFSYRHSGEAFFPGQNGWPARIERPKRTRKPMTRNRAMRIFERDAFRCQACGSQSRLRVDHILALANGGSEEDDNLQTLCQPCNSSKGSRTDWKGPKS